MTDFFAVRRDEEEQVEWASWIVPFTMTLGHCALISVFFFPGNKNASRVNVEG